MSTHALDNQMNERIINKLEQHDRQLREQRTLQLQGEDTIQVGYTADSVYAFTVAPNTGLIGTFLCTLQYNSPDAESVVFGELDIAVNKGTDIFDPTYNLSAYYGGLTMQIINDLYLEQAFYNVQGYHPIVKVVKLYTTASATTSTFYIHTRWRYVGVGNTLNAVTGDISIMP